MEESVLLKFLVLSHQAANLRFNIFIKVAPLIKHIHHQCHYKMNTAKGGLFIPK